MATATINATYQGRVRRTLTSSVINWSLDVRDFSTGSEALTYTTNQNISGALEASLQSSRGGVSAQISRVFLFFDLSSIQGVITSATLKVLGGTFGNALDTITTESTAWGNGSVSALTTSDYSELKFDTPFSSELVGWNNGSYNDFTLNSSAITHINNNNYLNIAVIGYDYDYLNTAPTLSSLLQSGVEFLDPTDPIKLEVTYVPSIEVLGVSPLLINKVNGSLFANISKVIGK